MRLKIYRMGRNSFLGKLLSVKGMIVLGCEDEMLSKYANKMNLNITKRFAGAIKSSGAMILNLFSFSNQT